MKRDGVSASIWQSQQMMAGANDLEHRNFDVAIIGAGITGVSTALQLQLAGKKCILIDAANAGFGSTGGTTAHLNTFYDTTYGDIKKNFGEDNAKLLAQGAKAAIAVIKNNIVTNDIDCDFEEKDGYLFSLDEKQSEELQAIAEGANNVGILMEYTSANPFPFHFEKIVRIPSQAQFNPIKYLSGLLVAYKKAGGIFVDNCRATSLDDGTNLTVRTLKGDIKAEYAIYATHVPPGINFLHFRCAPYRSYAIAFTLNDNSYPDALGYDLNDPYHYYRTQQIDGQQYIIAGGEDHKTGHEEDTNQCFKNLENYVRNFFDVKEIVYKWSSQYFEPADGLPYIGHLPGYGKNVFTATGFGGNGMIYGSLSAIILSNLIVNGESVYQEVLNPGRIKPVAGFSNMVKEGADVIKEFAAGLFPADKMDKINSIAKGTACIIKYQGKNTGVFKNKDGEIFGVNVTCPHIKCSVTWNAAEQSWDCPCHGSRFSFQGEMLTAPAIDNLKKVEINIAVTN